MSSPPRFSADVYFPIRRRKTDRLVYKSVTRQVSALRTLKISGFLDVYGLFMVDSRLSVRWAERTRILHESARKT